MNTIFLFISKWPILLNNSRIDCFLQLFSRCQLAGIAYYLQSFQKLSVANANSFLFFPVLFSLFSFVHFFYCTNKKKYRFCFAESQLNISIKANKRKILKKKKTQQTREENKNDGDGDNDDQLQQQQWGEEDDDDCQCAEKERQFSQFTCKRYMRTPKRKREDGNKKES